MVFQQPANGELSAGIAVTGISMITVPETVVVKIRWNSVRRTEIRSGAREETMTRVASKAGPLGRNRVDADSDEGTGSPHDEHMSRADPPGADRLQNRGRAANRDCAEHRP